MRINRMKLRRIALTTLADEQVAAAEISVALVADARIHEINRAFLGHDYATDVISFLFDDAAPEKGRNRASGARRPAAVHRSSRGVRVLARRGAGKRISGEVVISAQTAKRDAARFGWGATDELCLYLIHGLLHLCGYDDLTRAERTLMRRREADLLHLTGVISRRAQSPERP